MGVGVGVGVGVGTGRGELTGVCALRRMAVGFYCLGILDLYGLVDDKVSPTDSEGWRAWIWAQQASASPPPPSSSPSAHAISRLRPPLPPLPLFAAGAHGSGFRPGPLATTNEPPPPPSCHPPVRARLPLPLSRA